MNFLATTPVHRNMFQFWLPDEAEEEVKLNERDNASNGKENRSKSYYRNTTITQENQGEGASSSVTIAAMKVTMNLTMNLMTAACD